MLIAIIPVREASPASAAQRTARVAIVLAYHGPARIARVQIAKRRRIVPARNGLARQRREVRNPLRNPPRNLRAKPGAKPDAKPRSAAPKNPAKPAGAFGGVEAGRGAAAVSNRGQASINRGPAAGGRPAAAARPGGASRPSGGGGGGGRGGRGGGGGGGRR